MGLGREEVGEAVRAQQDAEVADWAARGERLAAVGDVECAEKEEFLEAWLAAPEGGYVTRIQGLSPEVKAAGTAWLQKIVDAAVATV